MYVLICCLFVNYPPPFWVPDVCLGDPITEASIPVLYPGLRRVVIVEQLLLSTTPATHLWKPTPPSFPLYSRPLVRPRPVATYYREMWICGL